MFGMRAYRTMCTVQRSHGVCVCVCFGIYARLGLTESHLIRYFTSFNSILKMWKIEED